MTWSVEQKCPECSEWGGHLGGCPLKRWPLDLPFPEPLPPFQAQFTEGYDMASGQVTYTLTVTTLDQAVSRHGQFGLNLLVESVRLAVGQFEQARLMAANHHVYDQARRAYPYDHEEGRD